MERIYRHPRTSPLHPETGQTTGERSHVAFACAAMRAVVEVDVGSGWREWLDRHGAGRRQGDEPAGGRRPDRGRDRAPRTRADGGDQTRDGVITNASFTDYLIPTALDMPPVRIELVEEAEPDAPYGVKGVGAAHGRLHGGDRLRPSGRERPRPPAGAGATRRSGRAVTEQLRRRIAVAQGAERPTSSFAAAGAVGLHAGVARGGRRRLRRVRRRPGRVRRPRGARRRRPLGGARLHRRPRAPGVLQAARGRVRTSSTCCRFGTTAVVADPHEIANVLGTDGVHWLHDVCARLPLDVFFIGLLVHSGVGLRVATPGADAR